MGSIIEIKCSSCNADWVCTIGCGMWDISFDHAIRAYSEEVKKQICDSVTGKEPVFDFEYRKARCTCCHNMLSVSVLDLKDTQKEYVSVCGQCGGEVEIIQDISQTPCPCCGKLSLQEEEIGLWD